MPKKTRGHGTSETHTEPAAPGDTGHASRDTHAVLADISALCAALKDLQVRRRHLIRSKDRNRLALGSLVRRHLGWRADLPEKEREAIRKRAADMIDKAVAGEIQDGEEWLIEFALDCEASCAPFDRRLAHVEKEMVALASLLPAAPWVEGVRGFGMKTLGVIVGEAGDIGSYKNPAKLWKRLGLAPKSEYAQADNGAHMVPKQRRAQIWACLGDPLLKLNDVDYRQAYDGKKAEYLARGWTKNHAHRAAHRYMEKRALRDLWSAWRSAMVHVQTLEKMPISDSSAQAGRQATHRPLPKKPLSDANPLPKGKKRAAKPTTKPKPAAPPAPISPSGEEMATSGSLPNGQKPSPLVSRKGRGRAFSAVKPRMHMPALTVLDAG